LVVRWQHNYNYNKIAYFSVRQTTDECVYLVRCDHFRSLDKDGGHTIRSEKWKPHDASRLHDYTFYRTR